MSPKQQLAELEKILDLHYEKLNKARKRLVMTDDIFRENSIEQRIREQVLPEIRKYETEYWQTLAQAAQNSTVTEVDARNAIVEILPEVELIANNGQTNYPDEFMRLLLEIRDKLNEPERPAVAKAKLALNLIPGFFSYEIELDTESVLRRATKLQPIKRMFKGALEKN